MNTSITHSFKIVSTDHLILLFFLSFQLIILLPSLKYFSGLEIVPLDLT